MDGIMTSLMLEKAQRCTEQAKDLLEDLSESKMVSEVDCLLVVQLC